MRIAALSALVAGGVWFTAIQPSLIRAQSAEVLGARVEDVARRVSALEAEHLDARITVLESQITEVIWLGRLVAGAVAGQLVAAFLESTKRRGRHGA